eukprot:730076-Hanusia_phi.AAC.1
MSHSSSGISNEQGRFQHIHEICMLSRLKEPDFVTGPRPITTAMRPPYRVPPGSGTNLMGARGVGVGAGEEET